MIGWLALGAAIVALIMARSKRRVVWHATDHGLEPIELATPEQFGLVTHGGPLNGEVLVRRNSATVDEILTAGAYLRTGQLVRIQGDIAHPTPDIGPIGWKP
jgi:hypothetical protein